ncbi:hypothetical protein [Aestuariibaculum marinum]|uniref:Phage head morphogenesis domain-containing protein n=1 Tax=Aestuariibaculum marinum TaxID=2683592 RepID=A0A8J6PT39_9FLAO|nr:hypothetical protein [Aestuariibaculum marinum]MBD0822631.1 hypothetical protein [Aestuariibaculum marinum]
MPAHAELLKLLSAQDASLSRVYAAMSKDLAVVLKKYKLNSNSKIWHRNLHVKKEVEAVLTKYQSILFDHISKGTTDAWSMADNHNDAFVDNYVKGVKLPNPALYYQRNTEALQAFLKRSSNGLDLSKRVWNLTNQTQSQLEYFIADGLTEGRSAAKLAGDIQKYLKAPDKRFRRKRSPITGKLISSDPAKDYKPGTGVYRSSYKNALRLARNEINIAYRTADMERRKQLDFVVGIKVNLSQAHTVYDICDELKGEYPKEFVFVGWHPNCLCFTTSVLLSKKDFIEQLKTGKVPKSKYIKSIPESASNYLNKNSERIKGLSNTPYFIRDNFKNTKDGFALKNSIGTVNPKPTQSFKTEAPIDPYKPVQGKAAQLIKDTNEFTDNDIKKVIHQFSEDNPKLFYGGLRGVTIRKNLQGMMHNSRSYDHNGYMVSRGNSIGITKSKYRIGQDHIYSPLESIRESFEAIKNGQALTFDQEYALESMWHEMRHSGAKGWSGINASTPNRTISMEIINQFCARHTYNDFIESLGGKAVNQTAVIERGYGYSTYIDNFRNTLKHYKIKESDALSHFRNLIQETHYEKIHEEMVNYFKGKGIKDAELLVLKMGRSYKMEF